MYPNLLFIFYFLLFYKCLNTPYKPRRVAYRAQSTIVISSPPFKRSKTQLYFIDALFLEEKKKRSIAACKFRLGLACLQG